jgi:ABC-type transport system involved in multi-copper enzyme maturation permease subunit
MKLMAIVKNTCIRSFRDRILYTSLFFGGVILGSAVFLSELSLGERTKILQDTGLAALEIMGVFLAVYLSISVFSEEMHSSTIQTILSRPVHRSKILLGKFIGVTMVIVVNFIILTTAYFAILLGVTRILPLSDSLAVYSIFLQTEVLVALTILLATFIPPFLSGLCCTLVFVIGHFSEDFILLGGAESNQIQQVLYTAIHYIIPNLQMFNLKNQVVHNIPVPPSYMVHLSLYGVFYGCICLLSAHFIFDRKTF